MEVSAAAPKSIKIWERGKMIGAGGYGRVYLARILPSHPLFLLYPYFLMAVKSAEYSQSSSLHHERYLFNMFRDCPHIIRFLGYDFSFENDQILSNIFLEYASGGSLRHRIKAVASDDHGIDEIEVKNYIKSILRGLRCIHARGYVHCDINASNILLVYGHAKIADLGLMRKVEKFQGKFIGTREYMAPESIESSEYGTSVDIWGLGCIVFEMLTGKRWKYENLDEIYNMLELSRMSKEALDFLTMCFILKSHERWNADMLLQHPFIVGKIRDQGVRGEDSNMRVL